MPAKTTKTAKSHSRTSHAGPGLYLHVPFCRAKCRYCAFSSQVFTMEAAAIYQRAVIAEIKLRRATHPDLRPATLYIGGGTPSMLPAWAMEPIVRELAKSFAFAPGMEFTVEANPDSLDLQTAGNLIRLGANRLSLGIQSLSDETLELLGRPHTAKQAVLAYAAARQAGFSNVSVDMIFGLPGQRLRLWLDSLRRVIRMRPEHLSCYGLTLEPATPLAAMADSGEIALPGEDEQAKMFLNGGELLEDSGYLQYEISSFCRMGYQSRHNLNYWEGGDYLGLGPSAVSTMSGARWENPGVLAAYAKAAQTGALGRESAPLSRQDAAREKLMLGLRMTRGLSIKDYNAATGADLLRRNAAVIQALRQHELIRIRNGHLRLSRAGMLVSNTIIERLMPTFDN
ncbi:MAG: radical SAM family heme chaperone HemW [Desulfovibrionaceae bacterium]|nr:radical SAM family heme chaperone HemW [Desulfovibrionaceae bacterium]MBF0514022.1 radical SAM family heme chaperone HemW [Desulfovibrionaceae bacterium]